MRSVNYRVQGRFYLKKITEESLDNPSILEEIGDSATDETVEINTYVQNALQDLKNIGDAFLDEILPESPDTVPDEAATKEVEQNDQDNNQEQ